MATDAIGKVAFNEYGLPIPSDITTDEIAATLHKYMVGKTVLITGVSPSGLGAEAARVIALHSPKRLILASRSKASVEKVVAGLAADAKACTESLELDLGSQASIRAAVASLGPDLVLDVLINNAGIMMLQTMESVEAAAGRRIEKQFGTNHLGHFLLTNLLMPALRRSRAPRVVSITSRGHMGASLDAVLDDPALLQDTPKARAEYDHFVAYARSKTANLLFTAALAKRFQGQGQLVALAVDPGIVGSTALSRNVPTDVQVKMGWFLPDGVTPAPGVPFSTAEKSVASYIEAAYDPKLNDKSGVTITSMAIDDSTKEYATDPVLADRLWALSEELVGEQFRY